MHANQFKARILDRRLWFPDARLASHKPEGLVAIGGDLSVPRLLLAYRSGIFPWSADPITWWSPDPRAILELDEFHLSRSLARLIRQGAFQLTFNRAFEKVIEGCAAPAPGRGPTWIEPALIQAYCELHRQGYAHSVECWRGSELAGGLYGVAIGGFFAAESMFHRRSNASKLALFALVRHLRQRTFQLLDIQILSSFTRQLGARNISREAYLQRLRPATAIPVRF